MKLKEKPTRQKLTSTDRFEITRRLAVMDRDVVIGVAEVAVLHGTTIDRVYQASSAARAKKGHMTLRLPEKVKTNGRRAGWLHGEVRDLIGSCKPQPAATSPVPENRISQEPIRMGRPRTKPGP